MRYVREEIFPLLSCFFVPYRPPLPYYHSRDFIIWLDLMEGGVVRRAAMLPRGAIQMDGWLTSMCVFIYQIAESYWHLHTQPRSAFTQEIDLRPFVEKF